MPQVILAPTYELSKTVNANVTIEAEYGSEVWRGTTYTAAHHQFGMEFFPAPCCDELIPCLPNGNLTTIGVSHFDLDTLGGVLRALGLNEFFEPQYRDFWKLAEFVDLNGPHKLHQFKTDKHNVDWLYAFWAWSQANREMWSRDQITNITDYVTKARVALTAILDNDATYLAAGVKLRQDTEKLNQDSYVTNVNGVILRRADTFVNHLYNSPKGAVGKAVVAHNTKTGAVTVSFADKDTQANARDIVQKLWGPEAGGHQGIAGSPRGQQMTEDDLQKAFQATQEAL